MTVWAKINKKICQIDCRITITWMCYNLFHSDRPQKNRKPKPALEEDKEEVKSGVLCSI
jgi:hypothetical protein